MMIISRKISLIISIAALLNVLGLAAYVFDCIPVSMQSMYFYNLDRIYVLILLVCFRIICVDNLLKASITLSLIIYFVYFHIANMKYIANVLFDINSIDNGIVSIIWQLFTGCSILLILIYIYYYVSKRLVKR